MAIFITTMAILFTVVLFPLAFHFLVKHLTGRSLISTSILSRFMKKPKTAEPEVKVTSAAALLRVQAIPTSNHLDQLQGHIDYTPVTSTDVQTQRDAEVTSRALQYLREYQRHLNRIHEQPKKKVKLKGVYAKLAKIDRPVLISGRSVIGTEVTRILYPDGRCEYLVLMSYTLEEYFWVRSCFVPTDYDLQSTVLAMQVYDSDLYTDIKWSYI